MKTAASFASHQRRSNCDFGATGICPNDWDSINTFARCNEAEIR